jgi:hypothetical protein
MSTSGSVATAIKPASPHSIRVVGSGAQAWRSRSTAAAVPIAATEGRNSRT